MIEIYKTLVPGQILHGTTVLKCRRCGRTCGLSVYGVLGKPGRILCPCGKDFAPPPPFDAVYLLQQTAGHGNRQMTNLTITRI